MDTNNLQTFVAVAEERSFSRAAERLYLTQPAVSKRVAALEQELKLRLFDRIGRQVQLTEAGDQLLPSARRILLEIEDSLRGLRNLSGQTLGRLSMATSHHIGLHRLPPVLKTYTRNYPDVHLDLRFMDSEAACLAVEHGELELAVVTLPLSPSDSLRVERIWPDPLTIAVGPEHPLRHQPDVTPQALALWPAVLPAEGTFTRRILEEALAPLGLELKIGLSTNYIETLKMLVSVGLGWSLMPAAMLEGSELTAMPCPDLDLHLHRDLGLVTHRERTLSNAAAAMMEVCQAHR